MCSCICKGEGECGDFRDSTWFVTVNVCMNCVTYGEPFVSHSILTALEASPLRISLHPRFCMSSLTLFVCAFWHGCRLTPSEKQNVGNGDIGKPNLLHVFFFSTVGCIVGSCRVDNVIPVLLLIATSYRITPLFRCAFIKIMWNQ